MQAGTPAIGSRIRAKAADLLNDWISESERRTRITREFETRQRRRCGIAFLGQREHLKGAPEHFWMQQRLQRAFGFGRIRQERLTPIASGQFA